MRKLIHEAASLFERRGWRGPLVFDVARVLGAARVITPAQAIHVWSLYPRRVKVPYRLETVAWCAAQNRLGQEWDFAPLYDFSLREILEILDGVNGVPHISFDSDRWWLAKEEHCWSDEPIAAEGCLVNLCGDNEGMSWFDQEHEMRARACPRVVRAPSAVMAQVLLDIHFLHEKRLLFDWSHWGPEEDSRGRRVCVGPFEEQGIKIGSADPSSKDPRRAVCYMIPPEF